VLLHEDAAGLDDVLGLAVEEPDRADIGLQAVDAEGQYGLRCVGDLVESSVACAESITETSNSKGVP
jgi:hypothetical protein